MTGEQIEHLRSIKDRYEVHVIMHAAVSRQTGAVGLNGRLPWKPDAGDISRLRSQVMGGVVMMGANTFTSLGDHYNSALRFFIENCVLLVYNRDLRAPLEMQMENALKAAALKGRRLHILGGPTTYKLWTPLADEVHLTFYDYEGEADAYYPFPNGVLS